MDNVYILMTRAGTVIYTAYSREAAVSAKSALEALPDYDFHIDIYRVTKMEMVR